MANIDIEAPGDDADDLKLAILALLATPPTTAAEADGAPVAVVAGDGGATSGIGGRASLTAGSSSDDAGSVQVKGGDNLTTGPGGYAKLIAGDGYLGGYAAVEGGQGAAGGGGPTNVRAGNGGGVGVGGDISITSGDGGPDGGAGGWIRITAGEGHTDESEEVAGDGGTITLAAGHATGTGDNGGGNIELVPGSASGTGVKGHIKVGGLENFANDAAAATGGVPVGGLYRTASAVMVRVA